MLYNPVMDGRLAVRSWGWAGVKNTPPVDIVLLVGPGGNHMIEIGPKIINYYYIEHVINFSVKSRHSRFSYELLNRLSSQNG